MGKFYRGSFRTLTSAEYSKYHKGSQRSPLQPRVSLGDAYASDSWLPAKVYIEGNGFECGGWGGVFLEVSKYLIQKNEQAISAFVDAMGVGWIHRGRYAMKVPLQATGDWHVDVGIDDSVLIARMKHLVSAAGLSLKDVYISNTTKDAPIPKIAKRKITIVKDDSPAPTLDTTQMQFVKSRARNARLLAPAGAGKTLTMLHRCAELISRNKNSKILLVTFTRAARDELKLRLDTRKEFEGLSEHVVVTTLNQYGYRLLKKKFSSCRLITEKTDKKFILGNQLRIVAKKSKSIADNIDSKKWAMRNSPKILEVIDAFKSLGMDHREISDAKKFAAWVKEIVNGELRDLYFAQVDRLIRLKILPEDDACKVSSKRVYDLFIKFHCAACEVLQTMNYFTIEDQKYWGWLSLRDAPKVRGAARYTHIMVDEFQDVNPIDMLFVSSIAKQHQAYLTIVGDDDQTIFEWRGATPAYIVNPDACFKDINDGGAFETFILSKNYRSPANIVSVSQKLIQNNKNRVEKKVVAVQKTKADISIVKSEDFDKIAQLAIDDISNDQINKVVLVSRKKSQLIPYQIIFASKKIDFYAAEDLNIFLTDAFRVLRSLILIKVRQHTLDVATTDMVEDIITLVNHFKRYPLNRMDADMLRTSLLSSAPDTYKDLVSTLKKLPGIGKISDFSAVAAAIKGFFDAATIEEMLDCISENFDGFRKDFQKADDDIFYADPPFAELAKFSVRYGSDFEKFYSDIELTVATLATVVHVENDSDEVSDNAKEAYTSKLHLMTALRTKGREFDSVYILHANNGVWPISKATTENRLEAERRLFYVAVTRAKKKLCFVKSSEQSTPYLEEMGLVRKRAQK